MPDLKTGPRAQALMHHFEDCKLVAYLCPAKVWTIGWGNTGPNVVKGTRWTQAQADAAFAHRLANEFEPAVIRAIGDAPTTPAQFGAMVALAYNIGVGTFAKSSVAKFHRAGMTEAAANAFALFNRADGKVSNGLIRRRAAEAALYRGDMAEVTRLTNGEVK